ncbi:SecDF P1 head subdomain-containing protein [Streptomyces hoynatensis]|uniref:SecDF P1 head subdomain domain-containing protein n=1 Tax=Streptomyces hoynatensis TaxID=1141874 RepID=A0A3A9YT21_9ACTN|nr:hypothetical protein [Streptomyces hoynatensis]RKN39171.1 hypothetical protein D7294_21565 [Streptomyces hoynatensis]
MSYGDAGGPAQDGPGTPGPSGPPSPHLPRQPQQARHPWQPRQPQQFRQPPQSPQPPGVPEFPGPPAPRPPGPPGPQAGGSPRPGRLAGNSAALLLVAVLALLGGLLTFLALASADNAARADGRLAEPLRVLPVTAAAAGGCPATGGNTVEDVSHDACLTIAPERGMVTDRLREVVAVADPVNPATWQVQITFQPEDATAFGALSADVARREPPANRIAMLHGDRLLAAPALPEPITGGSIVLAGDYSRDEAEDLADELRA